MRKTAAGNLHKPTPVILAPSLLSADFSKLGAELKAVLRAGCSWIHLDIMDNHFVPNLTFGPPVVASLRKVSKKAYFDAHLMVEEPQNLIEPFARAGVQNLTVHAEACGDRLGQIIEDVKALNMHIGVSIKPGTSINVLEDVLGQIDLVLVMTVEPGFGGQPLIPNCLNKIRTLRKLRDKNRLKLHIQADGGINEETAQLVAAAGSDVLVAGSAVFKNGEVAENVARLQRVLGQTTVRA
ncbi:MAG: ribulose-phosphate 3-epimerase [Candidatus Sumerlaeaceae bacterium]